MPAIPPHAIVIEGSYSNINDNGNGTILSDRCDGDVHYVTVVDKNGAIHHYRDYRSCRDEGAVERLVNTLL